MWPFTKKKKKQEPKYRSSYSAPSQSTNDSGIVLLDLGSSEKSNCNNHSHAGDCHHTSYESSSYDSSSSSDSGGGSDGGGGGGG